MRHLMLASSAMAVSSAFATNPTPAAKADDTAKTKRVEPQLTAAVKLDVVAMPTKTSKRGSTSLYNFDSLTEIGMCFGVKNKTAANLSSIVSNANRRAMTEKRDASGNVVFKTKELTAADGTKSTVPTTDAEMVPTKHFFAHDVDADTAKKLKGTALEGSTVLIYRDK